MPIMTPTDPKGDGLEEELDEGDIVIRDKDGKEIRFRPVQLDEQ